MNFVLNGRICRPENGQLLDDLKQVAHVYGKCSVTYQEYKLAGNFYPSIFLRRFGSWNGALLQAGLVPTKQVNVPAGVLLDNLRHLWLVLGRQPVMGDLFPPLSG